VKKDFVLSRRALLGGLGAATAAGMITFPGRRAGAAAPTRFIVVHVPEGMWATAQRPTAGSTQLGPVLEALQPYQSKINVMLNMNMQSRDNGPGGDGHHRGVVHMLTGTEQIDNDNAGGASVDQKIASVIGKGTPFGSLQFGVRIVYGDTNSHPIWSGPGKVMPAMQSPFDAYKRIFTGVKSSAPTSTTTTTPAMTTTTTTPAPVMTQPAVITPKIDLRKSALDNALAETAALRAKLGTSDRVLLDSYQDGLRDIERRLQTIAQGTSGQTTTTGGGSVTTTTTTPGTSSTTASAGCTVPTMGSTMDVQAEGNYPTIAKLQMDLMVASLQCNLTRVCSLQFGNSNDQCTYSFLGVNTLGHDMAHNNNDCDPTGAKKLKTYKWYSEQAAYLLGKLASIPEGNGSMLDNTAILWVSEFSNSEAHASDKLMWMLMGNAGGFFKSGQVLDTKGRSVNDLHTLLCNAYGIADKTFGNPAYCAGALTGLT
jgi:hypothetical protein